MSNPGPATDHPMYAIRQWSVNRRFDHECIKLCYGYARLRIPVK